MFLISRPVLGYALFVALSISSLIPASASADVATETISTDTALPSVVVSATRIPTPAYQIASSISVITASDIEARQRRTLPDVLQDVPGINVVQTGSPGGLTSVFTRGTNANHTKVFVDGIDVSDPSSFNNSFDFSQVLASDIERVEVLRGPQSGLYGSDAIGGVINIITRKGSGPAQFTGSVEGGSFSTFNQTAGVRGSVDRFDYALNAAHYHTGEVQVTPSELVPAGRRLNDDYYDNQTVSTRLGANVTDDFGIGFVGRSVETRLKYTADDSTGPENARSTGDNREYFTRGTAHLTLFEGAFDQTLGLGYTNYDRINKDLNATAFSAFDKYEGDRIKIDWQGNIRLMQGQTLTLGLEHQKEEIDNLVGPEVWNNAGSIQLQSAFDDRFFNSISLRHDHHERFGGQTTYRIAPAYLIKETDTRLKASMGTGFKAPSLDQLYHDYPGFGFTANRNLMPEESTGYDLGFEQNLWNRKVQLGSTYFHNDIKNLIDYNQFFTTNINVGKAISKGCESFVTYKPFAVLALRADHTLTIAENDVTGRELARRPKHKTSVNASWQAADKLSLSSTLTYQGSWLDINRSGSVSGLRPGGYTLLNLAAAYHLGNGVEAYGRIDNALDKEYQNPVGFQRPGFGIYGGVKFNLDTGGEE